MMYYVYRHVTRTLYYIEYKKTRTARRSSVIGADRDDCRALTRPECYCHEKLININEYDTHRREHTVSPLNKKNLKSAQEQLKPRSRMKTVEEY